MRIQLPEIEIDESTGFDSKIDIFGRVEFGKRFADLVVNSDDHPVIALGSGWGHRKTTFINIF